MTDDEALAFDSESRFWRWPPMKWWIRGHGRDGYSFRLLLVPLVVVFVLEFVCVMVDALYSGIAISAAATLFLGFAGFHGARYEWLVAAATTRSLVKARTKQTAERFSSLGVGATVLAIFVSATSLSLVLSGRPMLDSVSKDAVSIFIALVFLPVYVSGAVRKLAVARIEELEALRSAAVGMKLKFGRGGAVRAVVVGGAAGKRRYPYGNTWRSVSAPRSNSSVASRACDGASRYRYQAGKRRCAGVTARLSGHCNSKRVPPVPVGSHTALP